jgi:hypothetical protein
VWRHEQQERVEVAAWLAADPPVQAGRAARTVAGCECAQHRPRRDGRPGGDGRDHRLVGGPQPVRVLHGHDSAAREHAGEHHGARGGGEHGRTRRTDEVHPAVARPEAVRRFTERHLDGGDGRQRPRVGNGAPQGGGRRRWVERGRPVRCCRHRPRSSRDGPYRRGSGAARDAGSRVVPSRGGSDRAHHDEHSGHRSERGRRPPQGGPAGTPPRVRGPRPIHAPTMEPTSHTRNPLPSSCGRADVDVDSCAGMRHAAGGGHGPGRMLDLAPRQTR